jgi:Trk-type K+ transport system membrane component
MGLLILAGNTAYPIFLRIIVFNLWKWLPDSMADHKTTLRFLLDHPRRCYTNLFPSRHTWWLAGVIIVLNGVDWAAFEVLNVCYMINIEVMP